MEIKTLPSYGEILEQLDSFHNMERTGLTASGFADGTERMQKLLKRLGSPHATIPAVHIAGTKGKGTVAHMVGAVLSAAGLKTGVYASPHVEDLRERIQVHGRPLGEQRFIEACMPVFHEAGAMRDEGNAPSWFEVLTAIAFVAFQQARVEALVLETGLGGRLDATNIPDLRVVATGITAISRDHEAILGSSLTAIAGEKAAIIREHVPVVSMRQEKGVMSLIRSRARELASPLFTVGKDIAVEIRKPVQPDKPGIGQRLNLETWRNVYPDIPVAMMGSHVAGNAALALGLADLFLEYMDRESLDSLVLKRAWRSLSLPARLEVVSSRPWHIVDGAHNPASAWAAAETVLEAFSAESRTLVFGVARDKDYRTMLRILAPLFSHIVLTPYESDRAADPEELAAFLKKEFPGVKTAAAIDPAHALELAREFTPVDGLILTAGSLWLAGEMRALSRREKAEKA